MSRLFLMLLALMLTLSFASAEDSALVETVLYDGSASVPGSWQLAIGVNTSNAQGSFDPSMITPDGYFIIEYSGTRNAVYLALSEWQSGTWASVNTPSSCVALEDRFLATFTFDQCRKQYGSADFSDVDQICVGSTNAAQETTIHRIAWYGKPLVDELGADAILFRGSASASQANAQLAFCFTAHVGGTFDASGIAPDARFYVEYAGPRNGVYLALSSHSGATHWARVNPSEIHDLGDGRFGAYFDYADFVRAWGTNLTRLDQVSVFTSTASRVVLHKLAYFAGEGEATDQSDGRWARPDSGIAFIGDSICQNAQLLYGDWNSILTRKDCCNLGIGGQTTAELRARIGELAKRDYEMIVFICGINDIGRGHTAADIVANYDAMIAAVLDQNPDCRFLLVSVLPTTSAFYTGQQVKIHQLNQAYEKYANEMECLTYVDVYSSFTSVIGEYAYPELLSDGLHPNQAGYAKMAEILVPYLPAEN